MRLDLKTGWRFAQDLSAELKKDRVGLISAGIAFYGLLSIFPAIAAIMAIGGLMTQPAALVGEMQKLGSILPTEASSIIIAQATEIAGSQDGGLGLAAVIGVLVSIYAASKAVGALIEGLHIAAGETDQRGFLASTAFVLVMTFLVIALAVLALVSTVLVPAALAALRVEGLFAVILGALRWPIVGVATALGLGALYRLSLRHRIAGSLWFTPGAVLATLLWLAGSIAFSIYVREFAGYNKTFGTLGGVVSLLMWMWLSSFIVLLGKEVDVIIGNRQNRPD
ncbi:MAG: ribonuclease BN [Pseudorhodobacter sp. PARRP1]|nr:MAG: ribonuclease BN [Pseudorhodobacter sp. PARRP1]